MTQKIRWQWAAWPEELGLRALIRKINLVFAALGRFIDSLPHFLIPITGDGSASTGSLMHFNGIDWVVDDFLQSANGRAIFGGDLGDDGVGVIDIADATTIPTITPVGGGVLYSDNGSLVWFSKFGLKTVIAPGFDDTGLWNLPNPWDGAEVWTPSLTFTGEPIYV